MTVEYHDLYYINSLLEAKFPASSFTLQGTLELLMEVFPTENYAKCQKHTQVSNQYKEKSRKRDIPPRSQELS